MCILYNLFFTGCLHQLVLVANGDEHAFIAKDETELDDTELSSLSGQF